MRVIAIVLALAALHIVAAAEDEFRDEFDAIGQWTARSDWLGAPAREPKATTADGVACFAIDEPDRGMKWLRAVDMADCELAPWLVIRYRVEGYNTEKIDYALWLGDAGKGRDGLEVVTAENLKTDGRWHTQAVDLAQLGAIAPVTGMALQCFATPSGRARLWVDYIRMTDTPPDDAEGYTGGGGTGESWTVSIGEPQNWTIQPSWTSFHTDQNTCEKTARGLRFAVGEPGMAAKWSHDLPETIDGARWVAMRYRARDMRSNQDYALYIGSETGGQAHEEQYVVCLGDLVKDNAWHVQRSRVEISSIKTLAAQVQAGSPQASLEIADITFHDRKPIVKLTDVFECAPGWVGAGNGYRAVELPRGNTTGEALSRRLGYEGWLPSGKVTAGGVPFILRSGQDAAAMTPIREQATLDVELSGQAAELHFIMAAKLPSRDEPGFGGVPMHRITQVERFIARIEYADGTREEQFPVLRSQQAHAVARGLHVYSLALDGAKALRRVSLVDGMRRGAFGLVAATLGHKPGHATRAMTLRPAITPPPLRPAGPRPPKYERRDDQLRFDTADLSLVLDVSHGLRVEKVEAHALPGAALTIQPGPLFRLQTEDLKLTSEDFVVRRVRRATRETGPVEIELVHEPAQPPVRVTVWIDPSAGQAPELKLWARCDIGGRDHKQTKFIFPELQGIRIGEAPEDTWYWMPRRGALINNVPIGQREPYSGRMPMQIIGSFGPKQGIGLYMMTMGDTQHPRYYHVQKSQGTVRLAVEYEPCRDGEQLPTAVIGCTQGDWHAQLQRYRAWVDTWYEPAAPRKSWFREVFNFRQQFLHFALPAKSGMFDPETKRFRLLEVVREDAEAFGGVDYLHLFDWGWDPVHGRCGDYVPWDYLGAPEEFSRAIAQVKQSGVPVGLYIEGYLVDPQSELGKQQGESWQLLDAQGNPYPYFKPSFNMCSWVKQWQDYLADTYARAQRQTGAVGFYIDEYGFADPNHMCYNQTHEHPIPATPVHGELQMTKAVREGLGPEAAIYTEESPVDVNSQYQDGSFTYAISQAQDDWSAHHLNLYRFAFPTFKTIEIIVCDKPLGTNVEALKRILFNGEAIWLEGISDKWFAPQTRAYIARMHRVLRANRECFAGDWPTPLVPTLYDGIYANRFQQRADGNASTCWTVYNTTFRTAKGELMQVRHSPGATYRDEMTGEPVVVRTEGQQGTLSLSIGPRDVAVISRTIP